MNAKKLAVVAVLALMTVPAFTAAHAFASQSTTVVAVEGHTVYALMDKAGTTKGFDIAVKVREENQGPNVLWFNDKYKTFFSQEQEPCTGFVWATYTGVDVLTLAGLEESTGLDKAPWTYVESYRVVLPDDSFAGNGSNLSHRAITDLYTLDISAMGIAGLPVHIPVWITSILNTQEPALTNDTNCGPWTTTVSDPTPTTDVGGSREVIPVDADIFGLWNGALTPQYSGWGSVIQTGFQCHGYNLTDQPSTSPSVPCSPLVAPAKAPCTAASCSTDYAGFGAWGQCTNGTLEGYLAAPSATVNSLGLLSNCDNDPTVGIDTLNGYSHPYGGIYDNTSAHQHQTTTLDVYFNGPADSGVNAPLGPNGPTNATTAGGVTYVDGLGPALGLVSVRNYAVDCVASIQCDGSVVGDYPAQAPGGNAGYIP
ncbi:MAG: hypothetical protein ACYDDF_13450 [Thermoplasmatota archaeon]